MRCQICDYDERQGSDYANRRAGRDRVNFHKNLKGWFCTTCARIQLKTIHGDNLKEHEQAT
jgi:hypothetical protein